MTQHAPVEPVPGQKTIGWAWDATAGRSSSTYICPIQTFAVSVEACGCQYRAGLKVSMRVLVGHHVGALHRYRNIFLYAEHLCSPFLARSSVRDAHELIRHFQHKLYEWLDKIVTSQRVSAQIEHKKACYNTETRVILRYTSMGVDSRAERCSNED